MILALALALALSLIHAWLTYSIPGTVSLRNPYCLFENVGLKKGNYAGMVFKKKPLQTGTSVQYIK